MQSTSNIKPRLVYGALSVNAKCSEWQHCTEMDQDNLTRTLRAISHEDVFKAPFYVEPVAVTQRPSLV